MNRKKFIQTSGTLAAGLTLLGTRALADDKQQPYSFITLSQSPLKYDLAGLEPKISRQIMDLHYNKHAAGYLHKLKTYMQEYNVTAGNLLTLIQGPLTSVTLQNNLGGHFNHEIFWRSMSPAEQTPYSANFLKKVEGDFGSVKNMKDEFGQAAATVFGSGWTWLCLEPKSQKLVILTSANQNNPLMQGEEVFAYPLIGIDVWEHAYYLQYQNRRKEYISAFESIVDWSFADTMYHRVLSWIG